MVPSFHCSSSARRLSMAIIFFVSCVFALVACDGSDATTTPPATAPVATLVPLGTTAASATITTTIVAVATPTLAPSPTTPATATFAPTPRPSATLPPPATPTPRSLAGLIAFASDRVDHPELYLYDIERNDFIQWSSDKDRKRNPVWAPDARTLAYGAHRDGSWQIFKKSISGGREVKLTNPPGESFEPAWSPDGKWIAFTSNRDGREQIYVMDAEGKNVRNLSRNTFAEWQPAWSPDGRYLAFSTNRDGNWEIYVMNADGANPRNLTRSYGGDWSPTWSPDGSRLAFVSDRDGNLEVYVMSADGSGATNLTKMAGADWSPAWSADGQRVVFVSKRDGNFELYVMNSDGTNLKRLTIDWGDDLYPAWRWDTSIFASARVPTITVPISPTIDAGPKLSTLWHFEGNPKIDGMRSSALQALAQDEAAYPVANGGLVWGFEPGDLYQQIYIRDSSWMSIAAMYFYPPQYVRDTVEEFLKRQYTANQTIRPNAAFVPGEGAISGLFSTEIPYDKHTTTSDEEPNLIRAAYVYYSMSGDANWLKKSINGQTVIARLNRAMEWLLTNRIEPSTSLIWRGHTTDWGDVKSEKTGSPTELAPTDARTASLFDQAMVYQALVNLAEMNRVAGNRAEYDKYRNQANDLKGQVEKWLWQPTKGFYKTHYHLTPYNHGGYNFDEDAIISIANALVVYTELASRIEPLDRLETATKAMGALKPGLSLYPPYPSGVFAYPQMAEGQYQNGGLWDWWGATQITAEFERGLRTRALRHLNQVADDWAKNPRDIYEWQFARTGVRKGSNNYGGSVANMTEAIVRGLYGIKMDVSDFSISPRLADSNGWIRAYVPTNGNLASYRYQAGASVIQIAYEINVAVKDVPFNVTLPTGMTAKRVTIDGQTVAFQMNRINEDDIASFTGATGTHTIEITYGTK